jgi:hypothetical protein
MKQKLIKITISFVFSLLVFLGLYVNAINPYMERSVHFTYSDGHYIASVANNIINGKGFSYWDGFSYQHVDPEISTGPVVIYPLAMALSMGVDRAFAFYMVPLLVNVVLYFALLVVLSKYLNISRFILFCCSCSIFVLSFQYWQWYLPLGEVPCFILGFLSFIFMGDRSGRYLSVYIAGVLWALALLGKMLFLMTAPAVIFVFWYVYRRFFPVFLWVAGAVTVFCLYLFSLEMVFPADADFSVVELIAGYVEYSWWYAFSALLVKVLYGGGAAFSFWDMFLTNVMAMGDFDGLWGWFHAVFFMTAFFVLARFLFSGSALIVDGISLVVFFAFFSASVICFWYFFLGFHSERYFFIVGSMVYFLCSLTVFGAQKIGFSRLFFVFAPPIFLLAFKGFAGLYNKGDYAGHAADSKRFSEYVKENSIREFMADPNIFNPYADISYYLGKDNRYYAINAFVDRHAELRRDSICKKDDSFDPLSISIGHRSSRSYLCMLSGDEPLKMKWKDSFVGGYYLIAWSDRYSVKEAQYRHCSSLLYHGTHLRLYWCTSDEMSEIIFLQSAKRLLVE